MSRTTKYAFFGYLIAGNIASLVVATYMESGVLNIWATAAYYIIAQLVFCLRYEKKEQRNRAIKRTSLWLAITLALALILISILPYFNSSESILGKHNYIYVYLLLIAIPHAIVYAIPTATEKFRSSTPVMAIFGAVVAFLFYNPFTLFSIHPVSHDVVAQLQGRALVGAVGGFILSILYATALRERKKRKYL